MKIRLKPSTFLIDLPPKVHLTLIGWNIPFVSHVKYPSVIFDKRITWRLHAEMIEAKASRTFVRIYSLFRSKRISTNIKPTIHHKALFRSVMTYVWPAWELTTDICLLKLRCLQSKVLCTFGNSPRCTPVCYLQVALSLPNVYDYIT
jgi:hypothetical protein